MKRVKITEDNFVWHVLTEAEAKAGVGASRGLRTL